METYQHTDKPLWHRKLNKLVIALAFIVAGTLLLGRNLGWVDPFIFRTVVSWQMLLIVVGIVMLIKKNIMGGLVTMAVGCCFLLPYPGNMHVYWPVILVVVGVGMLLRARSTNRANSYEIGRNPERDKSLGADNGYISTDVTLGGAHYTVLDPVFKGARFHAILGGIVLDLRQTDLAVGATYIDVNLTLSGLELYVPSSWQIVTEGNKTLADVTDRRLIPSEETTTHQLVLRGNWTLGGIEIKN